jgi:hypothetical protein
LTLHRSKLTVAVIDADSRSRRRVSSCGLTQRGE